MSFEMLLFGILPIVFYVFVDMRYGMKAGIYAAIVSAIIVVSWFFWRTNQIDQFVIFDALLMCGLGLVSLRLNNPKYFKIQPFVIGMSIALYSAYFQFFSEPLLVHYIPMMKAMAPPEMAVHFEGEAIRQVFARMSLHLVILFFVHSLLCLYAALRQSNVVWMMTRLAIYPAMVVLMFFDLALR